MKKKLIKYALIILLFTTFLCFIYALFLYMSLNEKYFNIITLLIGIIFYFLVGLFSVKLVNKRYLLTSLLSYIIITLLIYIIKCLALNSNINLITYKTLINFFITLLASFIGKKKKL